MRRRVAGSTLLALLLLMIGGGSSRAQTVPAVPAPVENVLAVVSPTISPVCGDATLVTVLLPALLALPIALPPEVEDALSPVAIACGAVPAPTGGYTCALDAQAQAVVDSITYQAAGTTSPVAITPGAIATQQVVTIEDALPPQVKEFDLGKTVAATFQCAPKAATAEPKPKSPSSTIAPGAPTSTPPAESSVLPTELDTTPSSPGPAALPSLSSPNLAPSPIVPAPATPSGTAALRAQAAGYRRAGLPIGPLSALIVVAVLLGAGLAWAAARPIVTRAMREKL